MSRLLLMRCTALFTCALCAGAAAADKLTVAVAANFNAPLQALAQAFHEKTGHQVIIVAGATGKHYAQIRHGAPFDLFFAADERRPQLLEAQGQALAGSRFTYALGRLALWSPRTGYVDAAGGVLDSLDYRHLALANPKLAPYGWAARQVLEGRGLWERVQTRLVLGESVAQTYQFVDSGNAALGFVALSQIRRPGAAPRGSYWEVPPALHQPIVQQAVVLKDRRAAHDFAAFTQTPASRRLIRAYGYDTPCDAEPCAPPQAQPQTAAPTSNALLTRADWIALGLTLQLAALSTLILLLLGTPLAWWLARSRARGKVWVEAAVALPLILPPTVMGFYLLIALGPQGPIGGLMESLGGHALAFTFTGLVVGSVFYSLPFVVQPLQGAFAAIGRRPLEVAATLRAGPFDRFCTVALPLARPGYLTAAVLGFAHTVGEFGVVLMIGGSIPGATQVVSIAIYDHVDALEYRQAHGLSAVLLVLSFVLLLTVYALNRRQRLLQP